MTRLRPFTVATALSVVATVIAAGIFGAPAADATSYRYWTYWQGSSGSWAFSTRGADRVPLDGTVDGWRFAISEAAGSSTRPHISSSFDAICRGKDPVSGMKRVGLVIDYGTVADSPPGQSPPSGAVARCLVLPTAATGYDLLVAATSIRVAGGLICGISNYPTSGCGDPVAEPKPTGGAEHAGTSRTSTGADGSSGGGGDRPAEGSGDIGGTGAAEPSANQEGRNSGADQASRQDQTGGEYNGDGVVTKASDELLEQQAALAAALETEIVDQSADSSPAGLLVGLGLLAALAAASVVAARRRR